MSKPVNQPIYVGTNEKLLELSAKRKKESHPIRFKQDIIEQAIDYFHKKEIKKG